MNWLICLICRLYVGLFYVDLDGFFGNIVLDREEYVIVWGSYVGVGRSGDGDRVDVIIV